MAVITASPSNFMKLLDLQQKSLEHVETIRMLVESGRSKIDEKQLKVLEKMSKSDDEMLVIAKETKEIQKTQAEMSKQAAKLAASVAKMADSVQEFKTVGERFKEGLGKLTKPFSSLSNVKQAALRRVNIGGIANKALAREQFVQQQKKLGNTKSDKELREDFEKRNLAVKQLKANEAEISSVMKDTNLSEEQLGKTEYGKGLLNKRIEASKTFASTDIRTKLADDEGDSEAAIEQAKVSEENLEVQKDQQKSLERIESYLKPSDVRPSADKSSEGGGLLGGLTKGLKVVGPAISKFGGSAGKGILVFFKGLGQGLAALASPVTLLGLSAFTLAMIGVGKALEVAAPAFEAIAPVLMKVAEVIGTVFVTALENIPATLKAVGDVITSVGGGIAAVITAIADSIVKVVDAVRKLFGIGSDNSAAEKANANITSNVGTAVKNMVAANDSAGQGPTASGYDKNGNYVGTPSDTPAMIMRKQRNRAEAAGLVEESRRVEAAKGNYATGGGNTVVAPVTTNNTQVAQNVFKMPTRNNDTSYGRYMRYLNDY